MGAVQIERASIADLVEVAGEQERFWGERDLSRLHHPMLVHQFGRTAFVIRDEDRQVIAYLFGLVTADGVGYVHLVSVREGHRRAGLARALYDQFETTAHTLGARVLRSFTQPANASSIAFHAALGFTAEEVPGYAGEGQTRTVFTKPLGAPVGGTAEIGLELAPGLRMRPVAPRDIEELHALVRANRDHLRPWLSWVDQPFESTAAHVEDAVRDRATGRGLSMAIFQAGSLVGMIGFVGLSRESRVTGIGYWLAASAQGEGIMTRAAEWMVREAFGPWRMQRVEIRVAVENARSRAIPERLGFRKEGELRRAHRVAGVSHDVVVYGLVADSA